VYAFEDGSAFRGAFERDRPVVAPGDPPFAPTTFLNLDVHDLLDEISETDVCRARGGDGGAGQGSAPVHVRAARGV
jgi:hypothetical protein